MSNLPEERFGDHDVVPREWNDTARTYPPSSLTELFEAQVVRSPLAPAVTFRNASLTYAELNERANRLAHHLTDLGARPNTLVAVCMDRSLEMVAALYAVLKAGAAYVPVDPEYPSDRISFMLEDASAPILLTQDHLVDRLPTGRARVVSLNTSWQSLSPFPPTNPLPKAADDDLAYMIYTSGSTGRPKGAMITQRAITNRIHWMQDAYGLVPDDRILQKTPFSFDVSVWEFFWPLLFGAQLEVAEPGGHRDSTYLVNTIVEREITTIHFVPSMLQLFLEDPRANDCDTLRRVICSGEALPRALQDRFFDRLTSELHNLYGPTEAAVDVTSWACDADDDLSFVPIGKPIANTQIHILDGDMRPVPVGAAGELHIGGVQVGLGYLNREQLTAERFVDDPFSETPQARLYKTGDLARYRPDGNIEFLGRADFQVKIRGFRVELGEIETAIDSFPGVRQSVVLAHERSSGDLELVAYVSSSEGADSWGTSLRAHLATKLPDYMVPTTLVAVDGFTLTPNGKIDRKALPAPQLLRPDLGSPYVAPRTELETFVAGKWKDLLDIDRVGTHDRFFELGGTSLQAARFINQLQTELGEPIFVVTVFSAPSVAEYAAFLESQYPAALARRFGAPASPTTPEQPRKPITARDVSRLLSAVPTRNAPTKGGGDKNPPAVFILGPPRSGTTLLRIMLAGHPDVFSASELQLLGFETLTERAAAYSGKFSAWLDGTIRSIMEIRDCDGDEAKAIMSAFEDEGLTTKQCYRLIQEWVAPRTLVDKSPSYALDPAALRAAETDFESPRYIHLVRHPRPMIDSFEKHHMEQVLYLGDHSFDSRQLAELVWTLSHSNITDFLSSVPEERWVRVKFEDLVQEPVSQMKNLCSALDLPFHPDVVDPYEKLERKMVDGVHRESAPMGDPGFVKHGRINPSVANAWTDSPAPSQLGDPTLELAARFGYPPFPANGDVSEDRQSRRRSLQRQRTIRQASREKHD